MKCKFDKGKDCIHAELFDKWKDDKRETAYLTLGICSSCPVYNGAIGCKKEVDQ